MESNVRKKLIKSRMIEIKNFKTIYIHYERIYLEIEWKNLKLMND